MRAGLPLDEALSALAEQSGDARARRMLVAVRSKLMEGRTLADSLGEFPESFPELYRSAVWCPFCMKQLIVLHDNVDKLAKEGLSIVACSPDTTETSAKIAKDGLKDKKPYRVPLLSDPEGKTADKLGVLNPESVKPDAPKDAFGLPFPTTIIVDGKGIIRFVKTHGDHRDRVKPEEMIAVAKKIRAAEAAATK